MYHTLLSALKGGQEDKNEQIDFNAVCDRVNHHEFFFKECFVGNGCSVLSILTPFSLIGHIKIL